VFIPGFAHHNSPASYRAYEISFPNELLNQFTLVPGVAYI